MASVSTLDLDWFFSEPSCSPPSPLFPSLFLYTSLASLMSNPIVTCYITYLPNLPWEPTQFTEGHL
ncbi:hypothetical protein BS47DRAFT_1345857 [Hydnum rufescens UP504]|uniref:Uncharacterized protein n=1 Tax=Hydnum rufescens UP504 TaxID=1448309 RepID=A0A9P6AWR3_9AGAM|nr:hypothetical protein BS47DRAFT_1345857 [Hydnum rufescens UP504]